LPPLSDQLLPAVDQVPLPPAVRPSPYQVSEGITGGGAAFAPTAPSKRAVGIIILHFFIF
jgi:hypothetical protein